MGDRRVIAKSEAAQTDSGRNNGRSSGFTGVIANPKKQAIIPVFGSLIKNRS